MNKPSSKTVFFICAVTIIILFTAAILACVSLFIKADRYQQKARLLNQAVIESTSISETLKASGGDLSKTGQLMKEHTMFDVTDNKLTFYYDKDLRANSRSESPYKAVITKTSFENSFQYDIVFFESETGNSFYEFSFKAVQTGVYDETSLQKADIWQNL